MGTLRLIRKWIYFALIGSFGAPAGSIAQELPVCTHQYYDADGDGFGWQNEASCLITPGSEPPPDFINKFTGEPVTLVRPYWDGNTDIATGAYVVFAVIDTTINKQVVNICDPWIQPLSIHCPTSY